MNRILELCGGSLVLARGGQNAFQKAGLAAAVKTEYTGTASALEVPMLVLGRIVAVATVLMLTMFMMINASACVVAEDAVVTGNFVCQAGFGQAIQGPIQGDAIHVDQLVLNILV